MRKKNNLKEADTWHSSGVFARDLSVCIIDKVKASLKRFKNQVKNKSDEEIKKEIEDAMGRALNYFFTDDFEPHIYFESAKVKKGKSIVESNRVHKIKRTGKSLKEAISDEAYSIAELIDKNCKDRLQELPNGDKVLRRDDFDEEFAIACREVLGLKDEDMDDFWSGDLLKNRFKDVEYSGSDDPWDLEVTVRSILGYDGYDTIYETDDEKGYEEGDLVIHNWDNEKVEESVITRARSGKLNLKENKITRISSGVKYQAPKKVVKESKRDRNNPARLESVKKRNLKNLETLLK